MGYTFYDGTITTDATEQNLFDITGNAHYFTYIFLHNMQSGDTITLKVYIKDINGNAMRLIKSTSVSNAQTESGFFSFLPATQYKVTIQRTAGTDRAYTWERIEVS